MTAFQNTSVEHTSLILNENEIHLFRWKLEYSIQLTVVKQTQYQWREQLTFFLFSMIKIIKKTDECQRFLLHPFGSRDT
jgi:hypothetical protein